MASLASRVLTTALLARSCMAASASVTTASAVVIVTSALDSVVRMAARAFAGSEDDASTNTKHKHGSDVTCRAHGSSGQWMPSQKS